MNRLIRLLTCAALLAGLAASPASAVPMLWGVDGQVGLFSIDDYTQIGSGAAAAGLTIYGNFHWQDGNDLAPIRGGITGFTLDENGVAYMSLNRNLGGVPRTVLMSFDTADAASVATTPVDILGQIEAPYDEPKDVVHGLSFQPQTGDLFGLFRDNGSTTPDRLLKIDPSNGDLISDVGMIFGEGQIVQTGTDLEFDHLGNLFVSDRRAPHFYEVDAGSAKIQEVLGDPNDTGYYPAALAWDHDASEMVTIKNHGNHFAYISTEDGELDLIGCLRRLRCVHGIGFVPPPTLIMPEPSTAMLALCGAVGLLVRRRRTGSPALAK